jgi:hypothetical protein
VDDILITLDVDWAPDFMIREVAELLRSSNVRSTWFVTHESEAIRDLEKDRRFEVGIHPCAHTKTIDSMVKSIGELRRLFPSAISMRTHGLFHSSFLRKVERVDYGIEIDSSIYLREMPNIAPFYTYYDRAPLLNVPFFWTEDGEMYSPRPTFRAADKTSGPGLKVFTYHPVHIWLNSVTMNRYNELKQELGPSLGWNKEDAIKIVGTGEGIRGAGDHFREMLQICAERGTMTLRDLAGRMREG